MKGVSWTPDERRDELRNRLGENAERFALYARVASDILEQGVPEKHHVYFSHETLCITPSWSRPSLEEPDLCLQVAPWYEDRIKVEVMYSLKTDLGHWGHTETIVATAETALKVFEAQREKYLLFETNLGQRPTLVFAATQ